MDMMKSILLKAVMENDIEMIKDVLQRHNTSVKDLADKKQSEWLMHLAVLKDYQDLVFFLVKNGANVNSNVSVESSPLLLAIDKGYVKMTELLLDLGANINKGFIFQQVFCPLHFAVCNLNLEIVLLLLAKGANVLAIDVFFGETALHLLCHSDFEYSSEKDKKKKLKIQLKIAKALLEKGAVINDTNVHGLNALDCAIGSKKIELCKLLLMKGAPVTKTNHNGFYFEYLQVVLLLNCPELARLCLERGCDYSHRSLLSITPYHEALQICKPDVVKVFLEFSCPFDLPLYLPDSKPVFSFSGPNDENKKLLTLQQEFIEGIKNNNIQSVIAALTQGAEPKGCSMEVPSTLHYVAVNGNHELLELLLVKGVPVNTVNNQGETPLFLAVKSNNVQASETFLRFGACINFNFCIKNKLYCVELKKLFKAINKCFKLVEQGNKKVLEFLENFNVPGDKNILSMLMNCTNRKGQTLMAMALKMGHTSLAEDLMKLRIQHL